MKLSAKSLALKVAVSYLIIGLVYIFVSDHLSETLSLPFTVTGNIQTVKGSFYVLITAFLLFILIHRFTSQSIKESEEKSKVSKSLAETENKYKLLFEKSGEAILLANKNGTIHTANPKACKLFGYTEEEFGKIGQDSIIDKSDPRKKLWLNDKNEFGFYSGKIHLIKKDGSKFLADVTSTAFIGNDGNINSSTIIKDISERTAAEAQINYLMGILNRMSKMAKIGAWEFDPDTLEGAWTEETARIHDLDPTTKFDFRKALVLYSENSKQEIIDANKNLIENKEGYDLELEMISAKGVKKSIRTIGNPIIENGKAVKVSGSIQDITEMKKIQTQFNNQALTLQGTIDAVKTPIFSLDTKYRYTSFNKTHALGMETLYGSKIKLGESIFSFMTIDKDINTAKKNIDRALKGEYFIEEDYSGDEALNRNYYEVQHNPISNEREEIVGISIVTLDITDQKRNREIILASERKYRYLFEKNPNPMFVFEINSLKIIAVNDLAVSKYGYSKEEFLKLKLYDLHPREEEERLSRHLSNKLKEFQNSGRWFHKLKNGNKIIVDITSHELEFSGKLSRIVVANDITDKVQAEKEIRKLLRGVEQIPSIIMITDISGNLEYVNPRFTEITGYSSEEVIGLNPRFLKSGTTTDEEYREMWETIHSGHDWKGEFLNIKKNKEFYWESVSISPILNEAGEIINFISIGQDITEQKKNIKELIEAKEKAEEINKIKTFFFATMSHELRTPFVAIMGYAQLLKETVQDPENFEMVTGIYDASSRLTETLTKILDLTKLEFEKPTISYSYFDFIQLLNNIIKKYEKFAENKNLLLKMQSKFSSLKIKSDINLIEGALINLVSNAIKFTDEGFIEVSADIAKVKSGSLLVVRVKDTGIGIAEEKLNVIWDEFRQASEGFTRKYQGSGLGLAIVRKNIFMLGGNITLQSKVDKGSIFKVELPVDLSSFTEEESKEEQSNESSGHSELKENIKPKLLYVEDDFHSRNALQKLLSRDYNIEVVESADQALEKINFKEYDAFLIDVNLGYGMNGFELTRELRKRPVLHSTPIIAITAYASTEDRENCLSSGMTDFIAKPFKVEELTNVLERALRK